LNISGHFLLLRVEVGVPFEVSLWSPMFLGTRQQQCTLEVWMYMFNMFRSTLRLVSNSTIPWVVQEERGNSNARWEKFRYKIGLIRQNFSLILEVVSEGYGLALMALDNLRLVDCFDGEEPVYQCAFNSHKHNNIFSRLGGPDSIPVQVVFALPVLIPPTSSHLLIILSSDAMSSQYSIAE
jgi:hypothetical protein